MEEGAGGEGVMEVTQMARRIAAILLLEPELDANYGIERKAGHFRMSMTYKKGCNIGIAGWKPKSLLYKLSRLKLIPSRFTLYPEIVPQTFDILSKNLATYKGFFLNKVGLSDEIKDLALQNLV